MKVLRTITLFIIILLLSTAPIRAEDTIAYAEYDSTTNVLRIFRDVAGTYENEQVIDDKTYFADIEDVSNGFKWNSFSSKKYITKVVIEDSIAPSNGYEMFYNFTGLTEIQGLEKLDTSNMSSMQRMFSNCNSLTGSLNLTTFDTSNVTTTASMFANSKLSFIDVTGWNVHNLTDISYMFYYCANLQSIDLGTWNYPGINNIMQAFRHCVALETADVSPLNTTGVTSMQDLFYECSALKSLDLSTWDTSHVTNFHEAFRKCESLETLNVSTWRGVSATNTVSMFSHCDNLTELNLENFDTLVATDTRYMFTDCSKLETLNIPKLDTTHSSNTTGMFNNDTNLNSINLGANFKFKGTSNSSNVLPAPPSDKTLGMWMHSDDNTIIKTSAQLRDEYPSSTAPVGRWVWQYKYKVEFDTLGYCENPEPQYAQDETVSEPSLEYVIYEGTRYKLEGWYEDENHEHKWSFDSLITGNKTLYANWEVSTQKTLYAEIDESTGAMRIYKDFTGKYADEEVVGTKTYYIIPDIILNTIDCKWQAKASIITSIVIEDEVKALTASNMFANMPNLTSIQGLGNVNLSYAANAGSMFSGDTSLTTLDISELDVHNIELMINMFYNCSSLQSLDLSTWNVQKLTNMSNMFYKCSSLISLNLSGWNVQSLENMKSAFSYCSSLKALDLSSWNHPQLLEMSSCFYNCTSLETANLSTLDTHLVADMSRVFYECNSLKSLDLSNWNVGTVSTFNQMFYKCTSMETIDVSTWTGSLALITSGMFNYCESLKKIDMPLFETRTTNTSYMFSVCKKAKEINIPKLNTSATTNMNRMFISCYELEFLNAPTLDTTSATDMQYFFFNDSNLRRVILGENFRFKGNNIASESKWAILPTPPGGSSNSWVYAADRTKTASALSLQGYYPSESYPAGEWVWKFSDINYAEFDSTTGNLRIFSGESGLHANGEVIDNYTYYVILPTASVLADFTWKEKDSEITSIVIEEGVKFGSCRAVFEDMPILTSVQGLENLNMADVTSTEYMFKNDTSLTSLDVSGLDMSNVQKASNMFEGCTSLESINLTGVDTSNVTTFANMFKNCSSLKTLNLSSFSTGNATHFTQMFGGCSALTSLDLSNFDTSSATNLSSMFIDCTHLATLDISSFDTRNATTLKACFDRMSYLSSIKIGENFRFKEGNNRGLLPLPHGAGTTGKWVPVADYDSPHTSTEIAENYPSDGYPSGEWIWQYGYTVEFDTQGYTSIVPETQTVTTGHKATRPYTQSTIYEGIKYNLKGWYTDENFETQWDFNDVVTENLILHAKWEEHAHTAAAPTTENTVNATCTTDGSYDEVVYCTDCAKELSRTPKVISSPGHSWGGWNTTREATEDEEGEEENECSVCHTKEIRPIPKLPHTHAEAEPVQEHVVDATCEGSGSYDEVIYCSKCGEELSRTPKTINPLGHSWGEWNTILEPTEETEGTEERVCSRVSSHKETRSIPKLTHAHHGNLVAKVSPTCTEPGTKSHYKCRCDRIFKDEDCTTELNAEDLIIPATGHTFGEWHTVTEPTETTEGLEERKCDNCPEKETRVLPAKPHSHHLVYVPETPATETSPGVKEHYECDCGDKFEDEEGTKPISDEDLAIPETGHHIVFVPEKPATETEPGEKEHYECTDCGEKFEDAEGTKPVSDEDLVIPAHEHHLVYVSEKPATETEPGEKAHYACDCGNKYEDKEGTKPLTNEDLIIPATGHNLVYAPEKPATDTTPGEKAHYECQDCGQKFSDKDGKNPVSEKDLIIPEVTYLVKSGANQKWNRNSDKSLKFEFTRSYQDETTFDHFEGIEIDGKEFTSFDAKRGSVIITIDGKYLKKLSNGKHKIKAVFDDGEVETTFKISGKDITSDDKTPKTGDNQNLLILIGVFLTTLILIKKRR